MMLRRFVKFAAVLCLAGTAYAQEFEFLSDSDGQALARVRFRSLPAYDVEDLDWIEFTPAGTDIFGYEGVFGGGFHPLSSQGTHPRLLIDTEYGGLAGLDADGVQLIWIEAHNPPSNKLFNPVSSFGIGAAGGGLPDSLVLRGRRIVPLTLDEFIRVEGQWVQVPEPTRGALLLLTGTVVGLAFARERRRQAAD